MDITMTSNEKLYNWQVLVPVANLTGVFDFCFLSNELTVLLLAALRHVYTWIDVIWTCFSYARGLYLSLPQFAMFHSGSAWFFSDTFSPSGTFFTMVFSDTFSPGLFVTLFHHGFQWHCAWFLYTVANSVWMLFCITILQQCDSAYSA